MPYSALVLIDAIPLAIVYSVLGYVAFLHAKPEEMNTFFSPLLWMEPWWPYQGEKCLPSAKWLLLDGNILFPIIVVVWIIWWNLQRA